MLDLKFGCVLFDDPFVHESGWACVSGQKALRVPGTQHLSTDTVWLTNLSYDLIYGAGLNRNPRFRRTEYLRQKLKQITNALGLQEDPTQQVEVLAEVFERVVSATAKMLSIDHIPLDTLAKGVRELLGPPDPVLPQAIHKILEDSAKSWTICQVPYMEHRERKRFVLPPQAHAKELLMAPLPAGSWDRVAANKIPGKNACLETWLNEMRTPCMARVVINRIDPQYNALVNYGSDTRESRGNRQWVTTTEMLSLLQMAAEIQILEVISCEGTVGIGEKMQRILSMPDECQLSMSWGLFMENLWAGFCASYPPPASQRGGKASFNPIAPFLRAHDRTLCLQAAIRLAQEGMTILGYGTGSVDFDASGVSEAEIVRAALKVGVLPPPCRLSYKAVQEIQGKITSPLGAMQMLLATGNSKQMLEADKQIINQLILEEAA